MYQAATIVGGITSQLPDRHARNASPEGLQPKDSSPTSVTVCLPNKSKLNRFRGQEVLAGSERSEKSLFWCTMDQPKSHGML